MNIYTKPKVYKNKRKVPKSKWTTSSPNDRSTSPTPAPYPRPLGRQRKPKDKAPVINSWEFFYTDIMEFRN